MSFNWEVSIGDIIALFAFLGSIVMFVLTAIKQTKSKSNADSANGFYDAAKNYYDLMVDITPKILTGATPKKSQDKKAECDAYIVKTGSNKWIIKIFNKGTANANNVDFKYLTDGAPRIFSGGGDAFPIELLEPQKNVDYHFMVFLGQAHTSWKYEISWIEDDGSQFSKKGVLTLPLA